MGILDRVFEWGSVCVGSNGFRGQRVGAGRKEIESCSRERLKATPSPPPATVAAAPPLLRRPRIEVLLFHLAFPSPPHHPFLFLNGSLAPFLFISSPSRCAS